MKQSSVNKPAITTKQLTLIGVMTAVTCILGPLSVPVPFSPIPISFTNLAVYLTVFALGMKFGTISYVIYLCLGTVGLPVFSAFSGGLGKLAGPTGGYLVGFIFLALIAGFFLERFQGKTTYALIGMGIGTLVSYLLGTLWLSYQLNLSFSAGLAVGVIPYIPGDIIKIAAAAIVGPKLRNAVSRLS